MRLDPILDKIDEHIQTIYDLSQDKTVIVTTQPDILIRDLYTLNDRFIYTHTDRVPYTSCKLEKITDTTYLCPHRYSLRAFIRLIHEIFLVRNAEKQMEFGTKLSFLASYLASITTPQNFSENTSVLLQDIQDHIGERQALFIFNDQFFAHERFYSMIMDSVELDDMVNMYYGYMIIGDLKRTLSSMMPRYGVILIDDGVTDPTPEDARLVPLDDDMVKRMIQDFLLFHLTGYRQMNSHDRARLTSFF